MSASICLKSSRSDLQGQVVPARKSKAVAAAVVVCSLASPRLGWACAACYGQSDSPLAAGMNWGIVSLLGFILFVLGGVAGFFLFLGRRSAALRPAPPEAAETGSFADAPQNGFVLQPPRGSTARAHRHRYRPGRILAPWRSRRRGLLAAKRFSATT